MFAACFDFDVYSDSSGMDFRAMLKKKKYAKWGNDDEVLCFFVFYHIGESVMK